MDFFKLLNEKFKYIAINAHPINGDILKKINSYIDINGYQKIDILYTYYGKLLKCRDGELFNKLKKYGFNVLCGLDKDPDHMDLDFSDVITIISGIESALYNNIFNIEYLSEIRIVKEVYNKKNIRILWLVLDKTDK